MARQSVIDKFNKRKQEEEMELEKQLERELNSTWIMSFCLIAFILFN